MKILITSDWYPGAINGVVTSILNLKEELEKNGHEVKLLTLNTSSESDKSEDNVYSLGSVSVNAIYPNARISAKMYSHLVKELVNWHPDVIHSNSEFTTFLVAHRIAAACNVPLIHTYHTVYEDYTHYFCPSKHLGHLLVKGFTKKIIAQTDGVIVPTAKVKNLLNKYKVKEKIYVLPTGIKLDKFMAAVPVSWVKRKKEELGIKDKKVVLFLGRLAKEKNIESLIDISAHFSEDTVLLLVGGGPHFDALQDYVAKNNAESKVIFTGMVSPDEINRYYALGDIFTSASTSETQGLTYIEALSCGLPLVCINDECLEGVIYNGVNGYKCESKEELLSKINELTESDSLETMGRESRNLSRNFSTEMFGFNAMKIYMKLIENGPKKKHMIILPHALVRVFDWLNELIDEIWS